MRKRARGKPAVVTAPAHGNVYVCITADKISSTGPVFPLRGQLSWEFLPPLSATAQWRLVLARGRERHSGTTSGTCTLLGCYSQTHADDVSCRVTAFCERLFKLGNEE